MKMFAVADPNWGEGQVVLTSTIAESPEQAIGKAILTDERCANMYSGASMICVPPMPGNWLRMQGFGYRIVKIDIQIVENF